MQFLITRKEDIHERNPTGQPLVFGISVPDVLHHWRIAVQSRWWQPLSLKGGVYGDYDDYSDHLPVPTSFILGMITMAIILHPYRKELKRAQQRETARRQLHNQLRDLDR